MKTPVAPFEHDNEFATSNPTTVGLTKAQLATISRSVATTQWHATAPDVSSSSMFVSLRNESHPKGSYAVGFTKASSVVWERFAATGQDADELLMLTQVGPSESSETQRHRARLVANRCSKQVVWLPIDPQSTTQSEPTWLDPAPHCPATSCPKPTTTTAIIQRTACI